MGASRALVLEHPARAAGVARTLTVRMAAAMAQMHRSVAFIRDRARARPERADAAVLAAVLEGVLEIRQLLASEMVHVPDFSEFEDEFYGLMTAVADLHQFYSEFKKRPVP
jgi:hypothetical protein